ncbi:MAG TPA: phosphatase PAP2 family protein [Thermoanaerobaculia bacterium]
MVSAGVFVMVARAVARRKTAPIDLQVHEQTAVGSGHPVREAAEAASPIGKWWTYVPAAVLTAGCVAGGPACVRDRPSRFYGAASIIAAAAAAALINKRLDNLPQPPAPPGRSSPTHPVFPSGHAFGTASVALTAAYVLSREELVAAAIAFPLAMVVPVASAAGRLLEEKHWLSDIVGGYLAAITLASVAVAAYEAARERADGLTTTRG